MKLAMAITINKPTITINANQPGTGLASATGWPNAAAGTQINNATQRIESRFRMR